MSGCLLEEGSSKSNVGNKVRLSRELCSLAVALGIVASPFLANLRAQNRDEAVAELAGVVKGAAGAQLVLHLRRLDDNPIRYYDGYEETTAKDGIFRFA